MELLWFSAFWGGEKQSQFVRSEFSVLRAAYCVVEFEKIKPIYSYCVPRAASSLGVLTDCGKEKGKKSVNLEFIRVHPMR